ncbi:hypothetical protein Tco_0535014 [Tanacetum coccineum]
MLQGDVRDDFPDHYNEVDAARLAEVTVPLRHPPRHLLYMCRLTTAYRHPELSYTIKDSDGKMLSMDDFLQLPVWLGTVILAQKAIKKPDTKIVVAREKKDRQNLAKAQAKRAGESSSAAPWKKQARKNKEPDGSNSEKTISVTPLHHATPNPANETTGAVPKNAAETATAGPQTANHKNEVVNLSENTHIPTPSITVFQSSPRADHGDSQERAAFSDDKDFLSFVMTPYEHGVEKEFAVPVGLCFTARLLGSLCLFDFYRLLVDDLLKISLDVPPTNIEPDPFIEANDEGGATQAPPDIQATSGAPSHLAT